MLSVRSIPVVSIRARARELAIGFGLGTALLLTAGVSLLHPAVTAADTSDTINFQARLEDKGGAVAPDGDYNIEFKLYDTDSGGTALWTEDYLNSASQGVPVSNGYLSVSLGSITAFPSTIPWGSNLYLTMNIGGTDPTTPSWDGEMDPRLQLTAVPYAFEAANAATADSATELQATSGGNVATLQFTTPTADDSVTIPDASGTVCLETSSACGFATATGGSGYIQNGGLQTGANFYIQSAATGTATAILETLSGQTADLLQLEASDGSTTLGGFNSSGQLFYQSGTYSGTIAQDTLGQSTTYYLPDPGAASATICVSTGNCTDDTANDITTTGLLGGNTLSIADGASIGGAFSATGAATFEDVTNEAGAFQVKDNGGAAVLSVDTAADRVSIGGVGTAGGQLYVSGQVSSSAVADLTGAASLQDIKTVGSYAYAVDPTDNDLLVYDVADGASPALISTTSTGASTGPQALDVAGRYAYVALGTTNQVEIFNISNPHAPVAVTTLSGFSDPESVAAAGRYVYVANGSANTIGVIDAGNPASATVTSASDGYSSGDNPASLYVQDGYLYMVDNSDNFTVYDISNPLAPSYQDNVSLSAASACNSLNGAHYVAVQGRYAYVTVCGSNDVDIYDISNPAALSLAGTVSTGSGSAPMAVTAAGHYIYVALTGSNQLAAYDISDPTSPALVGTTSAVSGSSPVALSVAGRYAYLADAGDGDLQTYDLGGAYVQQIESGSTETGSLNVETNGAVGGDFAVQGNLTVGQSAQIGGSLSVGGSLTGDVTVDDRSSETAAETYTETAASLGYDLSSDSGVTEASFTTTFNVTGLTEVDGTVAFFTVSANKGTTSGSWAHTTVVEINGTTIATVATPAGTTAPASATTRSFTVMRMGGSWQVVGEGPASGLDDTTSTSDTADFAEWIPYSGSGQPQPGDVLSVGSDPTSVQDASTPYDNKIIGVVSTTPYSVAGANDGHSVIIALAGRVPVKVSLANGAIKAGDPLTASTTPGVAMKATAPGQIIGIALEGYDGTETSDEINVQLEPGYDNPAASAAAAGESVQAASGGSATTSGAGVQGSTSILGDLTVSGDASVGGDLTVTGTTSTGALSVSGGATLGSLTVSGSAGLASLTVAGTTTTATLTVTGAATVGSLKVGGDAEIDGHIITGGAAPTVKLITPSDTTDPTPAGTNATVTISGDDTAGTITLTTGAQVKQTDANGNVTITGNNPTTGDEAAISFKKAFAQTPRIILTPNDDKSAPLLIYPDAASGTGFSFSFVNLPAAATTYTFNYLVVQ